MTENLQYRLYNSSIEPPNDAWPTIAEQLDHEAYQTLSLKLQQAALTPPAAIWDNISEALHETKPATVIPINRKWNRLAVAATVGGLILLAGLFYFLSGTFNNNQTASSNTKQESNTPANNNDAGKGVNNNNNNTDNSSQPIAVSSFDGAANASNIVTDNKNKNTRVRYARVDNASLYSEAENNLNVEEVIDRPVSVQPETYVAPKDYLTIAAPNGQPAKISAKFTDAMSYVLNDEPAETMDKALKSISWKIKLSNWTNKLMSNPGFFPAATNFLDIIELEELLKE